MVELEGEMSETVPEYVVGGVVCFWLTSAASATDPPRATPARALQKTLSVFMIAGFLSENLYCGVESINSRGRGRFRCPRLLPGRGYFRSLRSYRPTRPLQPLPCIPY